MRVLRNAVAVVAGYLAFVLSAVAFFQLSGRNPHASQPLWFVVLSALYGIVFAGLGGALAARMAPSRGLASAAGVAFIVAAGAAVSLVTSPSADATWSQWAALILMAPAAYAGGRLAARIERRHG